VRLDQDYRFETEDGPASLRDLFRGRSQLLVQHHMFPGCPSCASMADGYNGFAVHLEHHDVAMTMVSRYPIEELAAFRRRMGWSVPYHTYSAYARGVDVLWGMFQWLDRAPRGRNESGRWYRVKDEY
jgi:predicted dithiol-disulfide oxidoreductase (DUF899 family)